MNTKTNAKINNHSFTYLIESGSFNVNWIKDFIYEIKESDISLSNLILSQNTKNKLIQIIKEYKNSNRLMSFNGLKPINKILLEWDSWCWKTTSALAIAHELGKGIVIVNLSEIISSRLWETSKNLNKVIKYAEENNYIIFFDEFDSISKHRGDDRELWEMKRLVNSLIQLLDFSSSNTIVIWATNNINSIDSAIIRRFEEIIRFEKPTEKEIINYIKMLEFNFDWKVIISKAKNFISLFKGYDFFKIKTIINNSIKRKILSSNEQKIKIELKDITL